MYRKTLIAFLIALVCFAAVHAPGNVEYHVTVDSEFPEYIEGMTGKFTINVTCTQNGQCIARRN